MPFSKGKIRSRGPNWGQIFIKTERKLFVYAVVRDMVLNCSDRNCGYSFKFRTSLCNSDYVVYFDDILVCSVNLDDHMNHIKNVIEILRKKHLYANL